jgi:hypothetical protein
MDEPFSALDPARLHAGADQQAVEEAEATVFFVTHSIEKRLSRRLACACSCLQVSARDRHAKNQDRRPQEMLREGVVELVDDIRDTVDTLQSTPPAIDAPTLIPPDPSDGLGCRRRRAQGLPAEAFFRWSLLFFSRRQTAGAATPLSDDLHGICRRARVSAASPAAALALPSMRESTRKNNRRGNDADPSPWMLSGCLIRLDSAEQLHARCGMRTRPRRGGGASRRGPIRRRIRTLARSALWLFGVVEGLDRFLQTMSGEESKRRRCGSFRRRAANGRRQTRVLRDSITMSGATLVNYEKAKSTRFGDRAGSDERQDPGVGGDAVNRQDRIAEQRVDSAAESMRQTEKP